MGWTSPFEASLYRSLHDAGFVCRFGRSMGDAFPSASLARYVATFSVGRGSRLSRRSLFGGDIKLGSLGLGKGP